MRGLSPVATSRGYSSLQCMGFSLQRPLLLQSTSSRCLGFSSCDTRVSATLARGLQSASSAAVVYGLSCSVACGILPDQGSNLCTLHWQADSQPLRHQGSPEPELFLKVKNAPLPFSIIFFPDNDDDEVSIVPFFKDHRRKNQMQCS